jgi:hypothetical protein
MLVVSLGVLSLLTWFYALVTCAVILVLCSVFVRKPLYIVIKDG